MLICLWHNKGISYIYDKSDMTFESVQDCHVWEYLERGGSVEGIELCNDSLKYKSSSPYFKEYSGIRLEGAYHGGSYVVFIKGAFCNCFMNDKMFMLKLVTTDNLATNAVHLVVFDDILKVSRVLFTCECETNNKASFVPLKDGLYVAIHGELVYKVCKVPDEFTSRYITAKKMKEVILGE